MAKRALCARIAERISGLGRRLPAVTGVILFVGFGCMAGCSDAARDVADHQHAARPSVVASHEPEPDVDMASTWWSPIRDFWTPVGWKDHVFHFNVFFNGTILAQPDLNPRTRQWTGQGVQLAFAPSPDGGWKNTMNLTRDDGMVQQHWRADCSAPVLQSEWNHAGLLLRQEVFSHLPGAKDVETGTEPLFAWVRLSIPYVCPGIPPAKEYGFAIKINAPHIATSMTYLHNISFAAERSAYPRKLDDREGQAGSCALVEEGGKVRLGIAPGHKARVSFVAGQPTSRDSILSVVMPITRDSYVDLLVPMLPADRQAFDTELILGHDRALEEANHYWAALPPTAALIETPEPLVNDTIRDSVRLAELISEKNPTDGQPTFLSGSFTYAYLWATPHAMACIMLLDTMGYHAAVEKHLEQFRLNQGAVKPPGDAFKLHPGYLSTPENLVAIPWLSDHGAILYTIAEHALLSGDADFTQRWMPVMEKACEFIRDARRIKDHKGVPGIMPPAVATDLGTQIQGLWNDGWMYKGFTAAVRVFEQVGHPCAAGFAAEARDYRETFLKAMRDKLAKAPTWMDDHSRPHHMIPAAFYGEELIDPRHPFYLDTGPLFLVYSGLVDAHDPIAQDAIAWFRDGPQVPLLRDEPLGDQAPGLRHEMSCWEPCYSWNVFHSHALGERYEFLEGMYSLYTGAVSRETHVSCETRGGITGNVFAAPLAVFLTRLAVVDDQVDPGALHLMRIAPLAWLQPGREMRFEKMPTEFGPVTLRARVSLDGRVLHLAYQPSFRRSPKRVVLHVPPIPGLRQIQLNDKPLNRPGGAENIEISSCK